MCWNVNKVSQALGLRTEFILPTFEYWPDGLQVGEGNIWWAVVVPLVPGRQQRPAPAASRELHVSGGVRVHVRGPPVRGGEGGSAWRMGGGL